METVERRSAGRPTKQETAAIADRVLAGARAAFCRAGIAGASMEDIAAGAGVTKHTIYRRYPSKLALLDAVVARDLAKLATWPTAPPTSDGDPLEALRHSARRLFDYSIAPETVAFTAFLFAEGAFSQTMHRQVAQWEQASSAPLRAGLAAAQAAGRLREGSIEAMGDALVDLIDGAGKRLRGGRWSMLGPAAATAFFDLRWGIFVRAFAV